ncbi:site-specific integrase [uncultured Bacteroides sp.]|uniref:site-specific integrase n=1 Tax=uncultured Bacteroides sp. TaxID=162156 RepID=UPI00262506F2|nr:site-specific integrase [uncultured Bacteroides sp.]
MRSTFKVLFYVKKGSEKPNGNLPLMCRITVDGEIKQFSCKMDVPLRLWDVKNNRASGKSVEAQIINRAVDKIRVEVNRRYQELMQTDGYVTAAKLKDAYLGIGVKQETLLKLFEQHNAEFAKKVRHSRAQGTFQRYITVCKHLREFIPHTYKREDIPLKELNLTFINDFEYFLRTEKRCRTNTVWGYMIVLKHIVAIARNDGRLPFNPFAGYINSPESVDRGYLTKSEIQTLMDAPMKNAYHKLVRDMFVFSVFTGLAYSDVKNLTTDNLQTFFDGNLWIITRRKKTNTESNIRLLDVPRKIIEKYRGLAGDNKVFPMPSNTTCNKILKEIGRQCGFKTCLSTHVARHTNATTVLLSNGVPIETVSRLLGHTNIKTTQIYAKITNQKISQDMETLSHKLEDMEKDICGAI